MPDNVCRYIHVSQDPKALEYLDDGRTLCTYLILNKGVQVCNEDHGHPLVYQNNLVGILSFASICNGSPPVYVRVSAYVPWINKIINNL